MASIKPHAPARGKAEGGDVTSGKAYLLGDVGANAEYSVKREAGPQTGTR